MKVQRPMVLYHAVDDMDPAAAENDWLQSVHPVGFEDLCMKVQRLMVLCLAADDMDLVAADTEVHTDDEAVMSTLAAAVDDVTHAEVAVDADNQAAAADHSDDDHKLDVAAAMTTAVGLVVAPAVASHTACMQAVAYHTGILFGQHKVPAALHAGLVWVWHSEAQHITAAAVVVAALVDMEVVHQAAD